ncbi:MAG: hypothetical protein ACLR8Y_03870 [Alistipes indistinctus]
MSQAQREKILKKFKNKQVTILRLPTWPPAGSTSTT